MKATVEQYAKGDFQFSRPELCVSESKLELKIEAGRVYTGTLMLSNSKDLPMKVMIYDDRYLFTFDQHIFVERECQVTYHFDGSRYEQGKTIRGNFNIIADGGEYAIPYSVEIVAPYVSTSMGQVKDMFQFAALAERSWTEALRLFESEDFEMTFLAGQPQLAKVYDSLKISLSANQALEEFLVYIHKKKVLNLTVNKDRIVMDMPMSKISDHIRVSRNTWGYTNIYVRSDCDFITLGKSVITSEDFFGNSYTLEYFVNPNRMEADDHVGHIYLENVYQKLCVEVAVGKGKDVSRDHTKETSPGRLYKASLLRLMRSYIDFRIGRLNLGQYLERSLFTLQNLVKTDPEDHIYRLGVLHMQLLTGESEYVKQECVRMEADQVEMIQGKKESCYYQYIKSMLTKDPVAVAKASDMIRGQLDESNPDLFYYWLYMHVAEEFREDKTALFKLLERLYGAGMRSPIMYLEVCDMFNQEPLMFRKIGELEQAAIRWGLREDFLSREIKQTYVLLAARERNFSRKIFRNLEMIYEKSKDSECLKVLVTMLISGGLLEHRYHKYYAMAVDASMKLIGLNESFLRSMDMTSYDKIPFPVLKYLNYKNTLSETEMAYLYANVIENKDEYVNVYHEYIGNIEAFMGEQIVKGNINDHLSVIYGEFLDPGQVSEKYAYQLVNIIFKRKLVCNNPNIYHVAVKHKEMAKEVIVPVKNGIAYVEIVTDSAAISLLDKNGNRYISTIPYRLEKLVEEKYYMDICYKYSPFDYRVLLYLHANAKKLLGQNIQEINQARELIHKKELSEEKRQEALVTMISYYDTHYDSNILQKYLEMVDVSKVTRDQGCYLIELMIQEGHYKKAYKLVQKYGFEGVQDEKLLRLVSFLANEPENMHDELLTAMSVRLYEHDKYGEAVLKHLSTHYRGTIDTLCVLWKRTRGILSDTRELEENALAQLMFTEQISDDIYDLFASYYYGRSRGMVVKGFLKQTAFRYMIAGLAVPASVFDIMYNEIEKGNLTDDLTNMAVLMHYSTVQQVHPTKIPWIKKKVEDFIKRGKVLPFFKAFKSVVALPDDIYCKTYLVYRSGVHSHIKVNYSFDSITEQQQTYVSAPMEEMLPGLYVKEFVVFRGERLLYSIEDENPNGVAVMLESDVLTADQFEGDIESRFAYINEMLRKQELREDDALIEELSHYLFALHLYDENIRIL